MIVGSRVMMLVGGVLVAGLIVTLVIRFIQDTGRTEEQLDNLKNQIEVRGRIDEAIGNTPSNVDAAIELLERRQNP